MNQTAAVGGTETLAPEVVDEASKRVEAALHGSGGGQTNGAAQVVSAATSAPAPAATRTRGRGRANGSTRTGNGTKQTTANPNTTTISITLPKDTLAYFEQAAAQAPFEPSVQKYLAWELRQLAAARQKTAVAAQRVEESVTGG